MQARDEFEATVFRRRGINTDEGRDEEICVGAPTGLLVLMQRKSGAARFLEIVCTLLKTGFFT